MSNAPTVLMGLVPLIRAVVRSAASDTATTVTADDSGTLFVSLATGAHTYTLPAVAAAAGKCWLFFQADTTAAVLIASPANDMIGGNTTADVATSASTTGDCAMVVCDGTYYYLFAISGAWTVA